jgi:hypothetical protein
MIRTNAISNCPWSLRNAIFTSSIKLAVCSGLAAAGLVPISAHAIGNEPNVREAEIRVDPTQRKSKIPDYFTGISLETAAVHPSRPYLVNNVGLKGVLSVLRGNCSIRFGGNTSDYFFPSAGEIASGIEFAKTICKGRPLIWGLPSKPVPPRASADEQGVVNADSIATVVKSLGKPSDLLVQIGNEPNLYKDGSFETWLARWSAMHATVADANPGVRFAGPDVGTDRKRPWEPYTTAFLSTRGKDIAAFTLHCYGANQSGNFERDVSGALNSACLNSAEDVARNATVQTWKAGGHALQLAETGSYRGSEGETLAGGLYSLKKMIAYAQAGWTGVNFHCGICSAKAGNYAPVRSTDGVTYQPNSTLYAMVAFQALVGGNIVRSEGLGRWQTLAVDKDGATVLLVLNQDIHAGLSASIKSARTIRSAEYIALSASSFSSTEVKLGNAEIMPDGKFDPVRTKLKVESDGSAHVSLCASCAAVITLR